MDVGDKLNELNLTRDEIERFTKAFKDDKFREMLRDYAKEISDPDNRKIYEEEIKLLEQERGFTIEFIHPTPFRVIKTSVGGKQKCFINICGSDKVGKPASKLGVSEDGRRGQCWSLPHSLHPGREDTDPKGSKFMIYDVIFHPDTLHIASKNKRFMDMVVDTATQGIQRSFEVTLDKNNVREMRTKYKGTPQPCVIRKPIPGYEAKEPAEQPDLLTCLQPDDRQPQKKSGEFPPSKNSTDVKPPAFQIRPKKTKEPTKPNYTVKYRSFIDLQDFRCSRDSAKSPRPKEIVITIDLPLLRSVRDTSLEVNEKSLLLESKSPAYRLDLPLAYPVDEEKGEAKFNKQRGQLTITLPVRPPNVSYDFFVGPAAPESDSKCDSDRQEEVSGVEEERKCKEQEGMRKDKVEQASAEKKRAEESHIGERETRVENSEEEEENDEKKEQGQKVEEKEESGEEEEKCEKLEKKDQESKETENGPKAKQCDEIPENEVNDKTEKLEEQVNKEEVGQLTMQDKQNKGNEIGNHNKSKECDRSAESVDSCIAGDLPVLKTGISAEGENAVAANYRSEASPKTENQHIFIDNKHSNIFQDETDTKHVQRKPEVGRNVALQNRTSSEELQTASEVSFTLAKTARTQHPDKDVSILEGSVKSREMSATNVAKTASGGDPARQLVVCAAERTSPSVTEMEKEDIDEDDLQTEQVFQTSDNKLPPALLREIDADGNEMAISDHSTSAGFDFQNKLMYELD